MRVAKRKVQADASTEGFVSLMDDFAALRTEGATVSSIGGYRVLRPRPVRRATAATLTLAMLASARIRATGFLSVLFVGGLGLAVLAGPANCPCDRPLAASSEASDGARTLSRFDYALASAAVAGESGRQSSSLNLSAAHIADSSELPVLSTVAMLEPDEPTGASPITTSAIEPLPDVSARDGYVSPAHIGALPAKFEQLSDAAPKTIKLAATSIGEGELSPTLPAVVVETPPLPELKAVEEGGEQATETRAPSKHSSARKRSVSARSRTSAKPDRAKLANVPRWARQMFDTPWQSKAFSYIQ